MSRRRLSDEERALWKGVTRSIAPLRSSPSLRLRAEGRGEEDSPSAQIRGDGPSPDPLRSATPDQVRGRLSSRPVGRGIGSNQTLVAPQPLTPLGRKMKQRIARGRHAIDGRLDLHGMTQAEAHDALLRFLHRAQERGAKVVLVITGKGGGAAHEGRGVLKRMVPLWLRLPELHGLVIGFESAATGHGGEGALYVRLRKAR